MPIDESPSSSIQDAQTKVTDLIEQINANTNLIEKQNKKLGTESDTHEFRVKLNRNIETNTKYLGKVSQILGSLKHTDGEKQLLRKLKKQIAESTSKFTEESSKSQKLQRENIARAVKAEIEFEKQSDVNPSERDTLLKKTLVQKNSLEGEIQHNTMLIREREKDVKEIESSIIDLGQVVRELNIMAAEQGEDLDLISGHIEKTGYNVEEGRQQLVGAEKYDKCGKTLICWILVVVTCAVLGLAIGIVVLLKIMNIF